MRVGDQNVASFSEQSQVKQRVREGWVWLILWESFLILRSSSQGLAPLVATKQPDDICQENRRGPGTAAGVGPKDAATVLLEKEERVWVLGLFVLLCSPKMPCTIPEHPLLQRCCFPDGLEGGSLRSYLDSALGRE